ncbi:MAG: hypothetical protein GX891_00935 [Clostridiales bacterium]|nr:hypothetical protein [Clostridiales bacterium]
MEYPNFRKCCGTCANWKEPNRKVNATKDKAITEVEKATCMALSGRAELMGGGCSACPKYRKWPMLK